MGRCSMCTNEIDSDTNYCHECGEFVEPEKEPEEG